MTTDSEPSERNRLLLGAGFVFGVGFTMLIAAMVVATTTGSVGQRLLASDVGVTTAAGIFVVAVLGTSLYFLAFPGNRIDPTMFGLGAAASGAGGADRDDRSEDGT